MGSSEHLLFEMIAQRLAPGADVETIDKRIWAMFGETWAVLCSDMSGFTCRTQEFGIIHFLALIYEMRRLMKPIVLEHNGLIVKTEADNLFVIFRNLPEAIACAVKMHKATLQYSKSKTEDYQIAISIGIGYGEILKLGDTDCFGSEVNLAFKLGEDTARAGETLLTPNAYEAIKGDSTLNFTCVTPTDGHLVKCYYQLI